MPDEASAMYLTGGDQKRRLKLQGGSLTRYRWDAGFNMVHEENYWGPLERTYVHHPLNWTGVGTVLGDVAGANPATGDYRYYMHDHLGSTRMLYAQNKALLGQYRFTPYGEAYDLRGAPLGRGFTGQIWDAASGQYYFPMRHYAPAFGRWTSREPFSFDGPNMYHYGFGSPINGFDLWGLSWWSRVRDWWNDWWGDKPLTVTPPTPDVPKLPPVQPTPRPPGGIQPNLPGFGRTAEEVPIGAPLKPGRGLMRPAGPGLGPAGTVAEGLNALGKAFPHFERRRNDILRECGN